ncbi:MAG: Gfo/Idh/MocA family oxidoreductase [Spirochaetales bacterium]|nr:MAG: Gfo/Idh/MocA family oxidoreductase [Spirochaetales bacterium]
MIHHAVIGTGIMAHDHARYLGAAAGVRLAACCDIDKKKALAFAKTWKIDRVYTDYRELLAKEDIQSVSIVTRDASHMTLSLAAFEKKRAVFCEKPLAPTYREAKIMADAAAAAGVINMVNFSYRRSSGLERAAEFIRKGGLGDLRHVEASYLQSWLVAKAWGDWRKSPAFLWRLSTEHGSAGTLGDVGVHLYDLIAFLCGDFAEINCTVKTFDKGVTDNRLGEYVLDANDSFTSTITFANRAMGILHGSRWAVGQINSLRVRVFGTKGGLELDFDRSENGYRLCTGGKNIDSGAWKTVEVKPGVDNYVRFIRAVKSGVPDPSDFANGCKIQDYIQTSLESARRRKPLKPVQAG